MRTVKADNKQAEKLIKQFRRLEWTTERLDGCPAFLSLPGDALVLEMRKRFPEMKLFAGYFNGRHAVWHYEIQQLQKIVKRVLSLSKQSAANVRGWYVDWKKEEKLFGKEYRRYSALSLQRLDDARLLFSFESFTKMFRTCSNAAFFIEAFTVGNFGWVEEGVKKWLKKQGAEKKFTEVFQVLSSSDKDSFLTTAHKDAHKAQGHIGVKKFLSKYSWILNNYFETKKLSQADFNKYFKNYTLSNGLRKANKSRLYRKYKIPKHLKSWCELFALLSKWQDQRKRMVLMGLEILDSFYEELADRTGIDKYYLKYSVISEYKDVLGGRVTEAELKKRSKASVVVWQPQSILIASSSIAKKLNAELFWSKKSKLDEVSGITASKGVAKGRAKVLLSSSQAGKMKKGDILIAGMTRPDYLGAMRKAAAIVTDEGGITCHAAIVSRELGIPGIVGTRHATQVFKDGDMIEVDAQRGIVRKV